MDVICLGVHVLDVQVRPVEAIPAGQEGQLVEEIRASPAGTAGGTAVTLAKLGATVRSAGAVGTDALGDLLASLLQRYAVDTGLLLRRDGVQTSASVLPIRPDGSRPATLSATTRPGGSPTGGRPGITTATATARPRAARPTAPARTPTAPPPPTTVRRWPATATTRPTG